MSFFYLIDVEASIMGIAYGDIGLVVVFMWSLYWIIIYTRMKDKPKFNSMFWFLSSFLLVVTSAFQGTRLYDQSLWFGIRAQRMILIYSLLYFSTIIYCYKNKISADELRKILYNSACIQLVLFLTQFLLVNNVHFLHAEIAYQQRGLRIYYLPVMLDLLFIFALDDFVRFKNKKKFISMVVVICVLLDTMVAQKFRMTSVGLLIIAFIFFLLIRTETTHKLFYLIVGAVFFGIIFNTAFIQGVIEAIFGGQDKNLILREQGRAHYLISFIQHPIFAGGYPHPSSMKAVHAAGIDRGILLVDNGLFGLLFIYGGIGALWFITFWIKQLLYGWKYRKSTNQLALFLFPLFFLVTGLNEAHWYWNFGFATLALFNALQDLSHNEIKLISQ